MGIRERAFLPYRQGPLLTVQLFVLLLAAAVPLRASWPAELSGEIVAATGKPLSGAKVSLLPDVSEQQRLWSAPVDAAASTSTDSDGHFRVAVPEDGVWRLRVEAPGYVSAFWRGPILRSQWIGRLMMAAARPVSVVVSDESARPVVGATVHCLVRWFGASAAKVLQPEEQRETTDLSGEAQCLVPTRLPERSRGRVVVEVMPAESGASDELSGAMSLVPSTETRDLDAADSRWEVVLLRGSTATIRVRDDSATRIADAAVRGVGRRWVEAWSDAEGRARVAVPSGESREFEVLTKGGTATRIVLTAERDHVVELPSQGAFVRGRVVRGEAAPADAQQGLSGALVWSEQGSGRSTAEGWFELPHLGPAETPVGIQAIAVGFAEARARGEASFLPAPASVLLPLPAVETLLLRVFDEEAVAVAGAEVLASPQTSQDLEMLVARTDSRGVARLFERRRDLGYRVFVEADGFVPQSLLLPIPTAAEGRSSAAQKPRELEVQLERARTFVGWVEDTSEIPIVGATVHVLPMQSVPVAPEPRWTDENGRFEMSDMPWGEYELIARAPGFAPAHIVGVQLTPTSGAEVGTITLSPGTSLVGRITGADEAAIEGALVKASPKNAGRRQHELLQRETFSAADGEFRVADLQAVPHRVRVQAVGHVDVWVDVELPIDGPVEIALDPAVSFEVRVVDTNQLPVVGARAWLDGDQRRPSPANWARSDDDGVLEFHDVAPGSYRLRFNAIRGYREPDPLPLVLHVEEPQVRGTGVEDGRVEIVLEKGLRLIGTVRFADGNPAPNARVEARGVENRASGRSHTGPEGQFEVEGLAPGAIRVAVSHSEAPRMEQTLEIVVDGRRHDFTLERGFSVEGRVVDRAGAVIAGAHVTTGKRRARWPLREATSDASGAFRLEGLGPGEYLLSARKPGFAGRREGYPLDLRGDVNGFEITLDDGARIKGTVLGVDVDELQAVEVSAENLGSRGSRRAVLDFAAGFEIDDLNAGSWRVRARDGKGRSTNSEIVELQTGEVMTVDLQFEAGHVLSGIVERAEEPVPSVDLWLESLEHSVPLLRGRTDYRGRFEFVGVRAGRWRVSVLQDGVAVVQRELDLDADREVRLVWPRASLSGRVVDGNGSSVEGARLDLELLSFEAPLPLLSSRMSSGRRISAGDGGYLFENLDAGHYRVRARHSGFGPATVEIEVGSGGESVAPDLVLSSEGELVVQVPGFPRPGNGWLSAVRIDGQRVLAQLGARVSADGTARFEGLGSGALELLIGEGLMAHLRVELPTEEVPVVALPQTHSVTLRVRALEASQALAVARLVHESGQVYREEMRGWLNEQLLLPDGSRRLELPAGNWTANVQTLDGAYSSEHRFEVTLGQPSAVVEWFH